MVGFTVDLSSRAHSVSGTARVVDDCTIEISNFSYDGGGLADVFVYGGVGGNYFSNGFAIGDNLFGRSFNNQTLTISLADESVLDRFNGISIWCVRASISFGDGIFHNP